jgi:anthranilate phosphoribosyltransferase
MILNENDPLFLKILLNGDSLNVAQSQHAMQAIIEGTVKDAQIAAWLSLIKRNDENVDCILGMVQTLQNAMHSLYAPSDAVDCCGTGGGAFHTVNISTAVSFVLAACGVTVAKHGNRGASSKCGAADVLEALGVRLDIPPIMAEESLRRFGYAFLMAPVYHPALIKVRQVRQDLGFRTIFNLLGVLLNPARVKNQLIGVSDPSLLPKMADIVTHMKHDHAWIVHNESGLDEIALCAPNIILKQNGDRQTLSAHDFGLPLWDLESLSGGDSTENAAALMRLLEGEKGAYRDTVLANAACVLVMMKKEEDLKSAVSRAAAALDNGQTKAILNHYISFTQGF